jgi:hypothetical protein
MAEYLEYRKKQEVEKKKKHHESLEDEVRRLRIRLEQKEKELASLNSNK